MEKIQQHPQNQWKLVPLKSKRMLHPQFYRAKLTFMSWKDHKPMLTTTY